MQRRIKQRNVQNASAMCDLYSYDRRHPSRPQCVKKQHINNYKEKRKKSTSQLYISVSRFPVLMGGKTCPYREFVQTESWVVTVHSWAVFYMIWDGFEQLQAVNLITNLESYLIHYMCLREFLAVLLNVLGITYNDY